MTKYKGYLLCSLLLGGIIALHPVNTYAQFATLESDPSSDTVYVDISSIMEEDSKYAVIVEFTNEEDDYYHFELNYFNDWHYTGTIAAGDYTVNTFIDGSPGAGDYWAYTPFNVYDMPDNSSAIVNIVAGYKDFVNKYKNLVFYTNDYGISKIHGNINEEKGDDILKTLDASYFEKIIKDNSDKNGYVTYIEPTTYLKSDLDNDPSDIVNSTESQISSETNIVQEFDSIDETDSIKEVVVMPSTENKDKIKQEENNRNNEYVDNTYHPSLSDFVIPAVFIGLMLGIIIIILIIHSKRKGSK